jgi:hypothetical protein
MQRNIGVMKYLKFFLVVLTAFVIVAIAVISISYSQTAIAQDHMMQHSGNPKHFYPAECCNLQDCYKIDPSEVETTKQGYRLKSTNEIIPYNQARSSPDGAYHKCTVDADPTRSVIHPAGKLMCFFPPEHGS